MIGPQDLLAVRNLDHVHRGMLGMGRGKRLVAGRMPVLRLKDAVECLDELVHGGNDGIPLRHGEGPSRTEIILEINDKERAHDGRSGQVGKAVSEAAARHPHAPGNFVWAYDERGALFVTRRDHGANAEGS
jgi:hypothetical protein